MALFLFCYLTSVLPLGTHNLSIPFPPLLPADILALQKCMFTLHLSPFIFHSMFFLSVYPPSHSFSSFPYNLSSLHSRMHLHLSFPLTYLFAHSSLFLWSTCPILLHTVLSTPTSLLFALSLPLPLSIHSIFTLSFMVQLITFPRINSHGVITSPYTWTTLDKNTYLSL